MGSLIAKNEDEYVKLAMKLASDIPALQNLRLSLQKLMSKYLIFDEANVNLGLESVMVSSRMIVGFGGQLRIFFNKVLQKQNELKESALMFNLPSILISAASSSSRVEALQTTFRKNRRNTRKFKLTQQIVIPSPCSLSFKDWDQDTRLVVRIG
ncbi:hypothetical protein KIW84_043331 [Lathyrus oleraceus]|uniref:Uncharacterized protein n=1 Tax=Pisum sativum TaxID=3888 RepID=A0A9D5ABA3_PEA|nr:hypothetical protein KIW84_064588 [Pisum sativum]KAI5419096.1 hypothetical protein KIW84_043331 [Pisum sativum]